MSLPRDIRTFLSHYHGQTDDPHASDNLLFYKNRLRCQPDDLLISEIHQRYATVVQCRIVAPSSFTAGAKIIVGWSIITVLSNGCKSSDIYPLVAPGDYLMDHHARSFPIRENGMNFEAQALQLHEAAAMKEDADVIKRIKASYGLMLDFYGMCLLNFETGLVGRSEGYKARYRNLLRG